MAGIVCARWNGAYSGVPLAVWNRVGCRPNSTAAHSAADVEPDVAADAGAQARRGDVSGERCG